MNIDDRDKRSLLLEKFVEFEGKLSTLSEDGQSEN